MYHSLQRILTKLTNDRSIAYYAKENNESNYYILLTNSENSITRRPTDDKSSLRPNDLQISNRYEKEAKQEKPVTNDARMNNIH